MLTSILNTKFLLMALLGLFLILSIYSMDFMTIENVKNNKVMILGFIGNHYFSSVAIFFISCVVFVNSPVPFAAIVKLLGGFFFGFYLGAIYNIAATVLACVIGFSISRYAFKDSFEKRYFNKLKKIELEIEKNGFYYFVFLRLVMVVPYFLINILAGISRISFNKFLYSTVIGVIPASLIYANGGSKLEKINSVNELFRTDIVFSLVLVAILLLTPVLFKKIKNS